MPIVVACSAVSVSFQCRRPGDAAVAPWRHARVVLKGNCAAKVKAPQARKKAAAAEVPANAVSSAEPRCRPVEANRLSSSVHVPVPLRSSPPKGANALVAEDARVAQSPKKAAAAARRRRRRIRKEAPAQGAAAPGEITELFDAYMAAVPKVAIKLEQDVAAARWCPGRDKSPEPFA